MVTRRWLLKLLSVTPFALLLPKRAEAAGPGTLTPDEWRARFLSKAVRLPPEVSRPYVTGPTVSTGIEKLDQALGGYPVGHMTEIYGPESATLIRAVKIGRA